MKILVINAGSSSLKYQLIDMDNEQVMAKGLCERIGIEGSNLQHTNVAKDEKTKIEKPMKDHGDAIPLFFLLLTHLLMKKSVLSNQWTKSVQSVTELYTAVKNLQVHA